MARAVGGKLSAARDITCALLSFVCLYTSRGSYSDSAGSLQITNGLLEDTTMSLLRSAVQSLPLRAAHAPVSTTVLRPLAARGYHEKVISHYEKPRNVSRLTSYPGIRTGLSDNFLGWIIAKERLGCWHRPCGSSCVSSTLRSSDLALLPGSPIPHAELTDSVSHA